MIVGVLGGGQLGRMLALAGYPLGLRFRFLDPAHDAPAGHLAECLRGKFDDRELLTCFADGVERITYEFENVPVDCVRFLAQRIPVYPPPDALDVAQDRLSEKTLFQQLSIPTPPFADIATRNDLVHAIERIGLPAVLKTRRLGYDGKGQFVLQDKRDIDAAWTTLGGVPLILEGFIPFERELSILAVRQATGKIVFYPLVQNFHAQGILRLSLAPAQDSFPKLQQEAEQHARRILETLHYVGVLAIEFFQWNGRLLANEMAPRVHNSGHWTIEGSETSQFENHLRAVVGLPPGSTAMPGCAAMLNLIGAVPSRETVLGVPGAHLHLYGKVAHRGRKLGHITLVQPDPKSLRRKLTELLTQPGMVGIAGLPHDIGNHR